MDILSTPRSRFESLSAARLTAAREHERRHHFFGYLRLALGALLVYSAWLALSSPEDVPWLFLLQLALFSATTILHAKVIRRMELAQRAVQHYQRGLARLQGDFSKAASHGERFADPHHPFSGDLDLFGKGGLFERLCHARTREGESILAGWLLRMDGPPAAPRRLAAAAELAGQLELRERLAVLGTDLKTALRPEALRAWAVDDSHVFPRATGWLYTANFVSVLCVAAALYFWILSPLAVGALFSAAVMWGHRGRVLETLHSTSQAGMDLRVLEGALRLLEDAKFDSELLGEIQQRIRREGAPASERIARLAHLAEWIDSLDNQAFKVLNYLFLFSMHFTRAADRWRRESGAMVDTWLTAAGEFEALSSLAAWHFENPDTVAPEWAAGGPAFIGTALRHPLIEREKAIVNDATLDSEHRLLLVSGSNMSGKSTFLRTIGLNAVLAHAGAGVPAGTLLLSALGLGASIRTVDSLQEGASRFYAELQRLKAIVDLSREERKLLFLLDELLSGTNSHDRKIGAEGIVETLLRNGSIGLVTTHDLALAAIADKPESQAANVHFEDQIIDGRIRFDYRMKPGVVTTSNALALMRAVGLDVPQR
ncbi:MAG: MutS-related protein [Bryobacteraceae bacterium]